MLKKFFLPLSLALIMLSCSRSSDDHVIASPNFVSEQEAEMIARAQAPFEKDSSGRNLTIVKALQSTFKITPDGSEPSYYIINYQGGGFIIISADNRILPVMAYSAENPFPTDSKVYPGGLVNWLAASHDYVINIKKSAIVQSSPIQRAWDEYKTVNKLNNRISNPKNREQNVVIEGDCNNGDLGYSITTTYGPLTTTRWGQADGYNDDVAYGACTGTVNGKYFAGCAAVALAQLMYYYQQPTGYYSWSSMSTNATPAAAQLIADLGASPHLQMSYGCSGSSSSDSRLHTALYNFGYSDNGLSTYNFYTVESNLSANQPVILTGAHNGGGWWIFGQYEDGHAWVCDGSSDYIYYECRPDPNTPGEWIAVFQYNDLALHMNWGWNGSYNGTYYGAYNWNPGSMDFNYQPKMLTGIVP